MDTPDGYHWFVCVHHTQHWDNQLIRITCRQSGGPISLPCSADWPEFIAQKPMKIKKITFIGFQCFCTENKK